MRNMESRRGGQGRTGRGGRCETVTRSRWFYDDNKRKKSCCVRTYTRLLHRTVHIWPDLDGNTQPVLTRAVPSRRRGPPSILLASAFPQVVQRSERSDFLLRGQRIPQRRSPSHVDRELFEPFQEVDLLPFVLYLFDELRDLRVHRDVRDLSSRGVGLFSTTLESVGVSVSKQGTENGRGKRACTKTETLSSPPQQPP